MEISHHILLLFWMEKKLIVLSHIYSIEYMGLVLWLWSLESNDNICSTKKRPFCVCIQFLIAESLFIIVGGDHSCSTTYIQ